MDKYYDQETLEKVQATQAEILRDVAEVCEKYQIDYFMIFGSAIGVVRHQGFIPWDDDIDIGMLREDYVRFRKAAKIELGNKYEILSCATNKNFACTVAHFQKKGTKFISYDEKECDYVPGIKIDIFVYDHLANGKIARAYQYTTTWILGRLLYLSGNAEPYIPYNGVIGKVAKTLCKMIRGFLRLFRITPQKIYKKFRKISQQYNKIDTEYYASFEAVKPWCNAMKKSDIYPMKKMPFRDFSVYILNNNDKLLTKIYGDFMQLPPEDKRENHRPYIIDFGD